MGVMMCVQRINLYSYSTYVDSQVRALCHVRRTSCMGTQHAHRVVVIQNTTIEDTYNTTEEKHREYKTLGK